MAALLLVIVARGAQAAPGDLDGSFAAFPGPGPLGPGILVTDDRGPSTYVLASALAVQGDGKIVTLLGGGVVTADVRRYLADGQVDTTFGVAGEVRMTSGRHGHDLVLYPDGAILVVGDYVAPEVEGAHALLVRLRSDGSYDPGFGTDGVVASTARRDQKLVAVERLDDGRFVTAGIDLRLRPCFVTSRYLGNGLPDPTFSRKGIRRVRADRWGGEARDVVLRPDDSVWVIGGTSNALGFEFGIAATTAFGARDRTVGRRGTVLTDVDHYDAPFGAAVQADGKVLVAGTTRDAVGGEERFVVLRHLGDGTLDPSFGTGGVVTTDFGGDAEAYAVVEQPDGKIVAVGEAQEGFAVARYLPDGTLDAGFGNGGIVLTPIPLPGTAYAEATAVVLQPDGKILVAGPACPETGSYCPNHVIVRYEG
jgi:uncharacterized delta-60 repeat protein